MVVMYITVKLQYLMQIWPSEYTEKFRSIKIPKKSGKIILKIYRKNPVKYNVKIPEKFGGHCLMLENSRQFLVKIRWSDNFTGKGAHIYRKKIPKNYRPFAELPRLLRSICRKIRQNLKQCISGRGHHTFVQTLLIHNIREQGTIHLYKDFWFII